MEPLRDRIGHVGGRAAIVALDVTDPVRIVAAFDEAEAAIGDLVDIVVHNSCIASAGSALDQSEEDWARVFSVNLDGARRVALGAARRLVEGQRPGVIVNVASNLGLRWGAGVAVYAASKAALIQMTRQHALEWARHGIRVNALVRRYAGTDLNRDLFASEPGQVMFRRIPQRRLGRHKELDGALLFLASEAGAVMTGSVIVADGGHNRTCRYDDLGDHVASYLNSFVDAVLDASGRGGIKLVGICQGGALSLCHAALFPETIRNLVTIVTSGDFHADRTKRRPCAAS